MSFPVNPSGNLASQGSQPKVVSLPQTKRIIQDIIDYVQQLKEEFVGRKSPITDDNQVLQRFCAKLEYLLQYDMKERFSLLGKRKDYWDYFCDCLASNKGANDGIKYVKSLGEHKTSLGKGRAFVRFSLVHQRLADSLQQCIIHPKTGEWYNEGSVWMQPKVSSSVINSLYDLNDLHFDLSPKGYDLDNAWPSFARNTTGGNWNVPASRRSSITSMDTLSVISTQDSSEISRLQQELASAEMAHTSLAESFTSLEHERQKAEQSVWMTQGELNALRDQLKTSASKFQEMQDKYTALEQSHSRLEAEKADLEKEREERAAALDSQQQQLLQEKERLAQQEASITRQLQDERGQSAADLQASQQNLREVTEARDKLAARVASLEESAEQMRTWDVKKDQQISRLEQQGAGLEQRNKELTEELAKTLSSREQDATAQLQSAQKFHDLLSKLKDVEADNVKSQGMIVELKHKCEVLEKNCQEQKSSREDLQAKLEAEVEKCESLSLDVHKLTAELDKERTSGAQKVETLQAELEQMKTDSDKTQTELHHSRDTLARSESRQTDLTNFMSQLMQVLASSSGGNVGVPDVTSCSESEVTQFTDTCRKHSEEMSSSLRNRLKTAEEKEAALLAERDIMQQTVTSIINTFSDKPDCSTMELSQQTREIEARVQLLYTQLSDTVTNNTFLKEQLQLAQGEHSDKGKQLSHLEGRLLELEKALKESRTLENSLQGQVTSLGVTLKTTEQQNEDLRSQLQTAAADLTSKTDTLQQVQADRCHLEKQVKDMEEQAAHLTSSAAASSRDLTDSQEREERLKGQVAELESALESSQQEVEQKTNQISCMQEKLKEGEETVEKFLSSMASLETDKASVVSEYDSLKQQLAEASSQLHAAQKETEQETQAKVKAEQEVAELSETVTALRGRLEERETQVTFLEDTLQSEIEKHTQTVSDLRQEVDRSLAELNQSNQQLNKVRGELSEVSSQKQTVEAERETAVKELEETLSTLKAREVSLSQEVQGLRNEAQSYKIEKEELRKSASSSHEETTKLLSEKQNVIASLQHEKNDLEKQVKELFDKCQSAETETKTVQMKLEEMKKLSESEKEKLTCDLHHFKEEMQRENNSLKQQNNDLTLELEKAKNDLQCRSEEIEEAKAKVESIRNETERLRSDSASEKSELEDNLEKLQSHFSELQTAMDAIIKEKADLASSQLTTQEEITELKADLAASADGYNFLLQSSQKVQEDKESEVETLQTQLAELQQTKHFLSAQLESASSLRDSHKDRLDALEAERNLWKEKEPQLEKTVEEKSKEAEDLRNMVQNLTSSVSALEEDDRKRREDVERLEATLQEKEKSYTVQIESFEQELSALQFQLSSEQLQHEESLRTMGDHENSAAEMSRRLNEQEGFIADLEKELTSLQVGFETERNNQNQQLEELKTLLKTKEQECRQLADQLQRTSDRLEETLSSAEHFQKENSSLRSSLDHNIEEREIEIRTLRSDNEQLKKQLIKAVRDKATLWQRTDALAYEHKRKSEGKWMDNSSVTKCMGCNSDFSLFLRKHHCRLCGRIFCYNCSDNWVDSTSSRGKARACGQCYADLQNLDASIARASLLPNDSDDNDSNVGSDVASQPDSQADDRSQSSQLAVSPVSSMCTGNGNTHSSPVSTEEDVYGGRTCNSPESPELTSTPSASAATPSDASVSESASQDGAFQVITQEEVTKSIAAYDDDQGGPQSLIDVPNMSSSMLLSAEDLARGEINTQNEIWVKPGRSFAVPIAIENPFTVIIWEFTVHPKDIEFSITYHQDNQQPVSQAEVLVSPTRCNSVKEPVHGELTAKQAGVYTMVFDNSYSRMTSKKVHYTLKYEG